MITLKVTILRSLKDKTIGLIGKKNIGPVYFTTRWGIHTFGVRFPIDVIILDREMRVVKLKESLLPGSIYFWNPVYNNILELPQGTIAKEKITPGTEVRI